jgi:hypothetical protein
MIRELRARWLLLAALVVAATTIANADMVQCKKPDGSLYVGSSPPENCVPVGTLRSQGHGDDGGASWKPGAFLPTPTPAPGPETQRKAEAEAAKKREMEERKRTPAVALQGMYNRSYRNGRFVEGTVANGASFAVYNVRVCIDNGARCQYTAPSTLYPGAQGTFSFEVLYTEIPDWAVTWDVTPTGE